PAEELGRIAALRLDAKVGHHDLLNGLRMPSHPGWVARLIVVRNPTRPRSGALQVLRNRRFHFSSLAQSRRLLARFGAWHPGASSAPPDLRLPSRVKSSPGLGLLLVVKIDTGQQPRLSDFAFLEVIEIDDFNLKLLPGGNFGRAVTESNGKLIFVSNDVFDVKDRVSAMRSQANRLTISL